MNQPKRIRGRILSDRGWDKLQDGLLKEFTHGEYTIEKLIERTDPKHNPRQKIKPKALDYGTISKILGREEGVDKKSIQALFAALGFKLEEIDHTPAPKEAITEIDPNFVGREGAIADLKNLIEQGAKAIIIHGKGGIGKTTLAWQFLNTQGFDKILDLRMAKETQNITSAESVIEEWLRRYFDEEPGREFGVTLDRLRQHLRNPKQRIGILIDNLEPALDGNGRCIEAHRKYVELFSALADPAVKSVTLITSRECLRETSVTVEYYRLEGLDIPAWEKFFNSRNIQTDIEVLNAMHQAQGGNAKAMQTIRGETIKDYNNSLAAYWQANKDDLLIEPDLEHLVISQFNRLQQLDSSAYKLLCRLGCYRYQDVPRVPENDSEKGLCCLLWDVPDNQHRRVIKSLQDRSLVEFYNGEYWLHPVIRAEAIKRLRESEDWETANQKAAEFWTESVKTVETVEDALKAFEAYYQYIEIADFEQAFSVITNTRKNRWEEGESLGRSFYRLGLLNQIISLTSRLEINNISGLSLSYFYNILANSYWQQGNVHESLKYYKLSHKVALELNIKRFIVNSLTGIGLCNIELLEFEEAIKTLEENLKFDQYEVPPYWLVDTWFCLAFAFSNLDLTDKAKYFTDRAYRKIIKINYSNLWTRVYSLLFLGKSYVYLGDKTLAFQLYNEAIELAEESHYTQVKAKALYCLAELYREQGNFTTALSHHTESIELLEKIGAKCDLAEAYYQLALTYQKMGDTEKSQPKFQQAIKLFTEMEAPKQVEKVRQAMENGENH